MYCIDLDSFQSFESEASILDDILRAYQDPQSFVWRPSTGSDALVTAVKILDSGMGRSFETDPSSRRSKVLRGRLRSSENIAAQLKNSREKGIEWSFAVGDLAAKDTLLDCTGQRPPLAHPLHHFDHRSVGLRQVSTVLTMCWNWYSLAGRRRIHDYREHIAVAEFVSRNRG